MEFIDRSKLSKQKRLDKINEEVMETIAHESIEKYVPDPKILEYLKSLRMNLSNREGKSKDQSFAVVATFPQEVHLEMSKLHGPGWVSKPGVLVDFLAKNPHYRQGKPMDGMLAGKIEVLSHGGNGNGGAIMPLFSTLCTSFERPKMLEECVKSVRANTFTDWQLIIGDSTKDPERRKQIAEYGERIMKEDSRIIFKQYRAWSDEEDKRKCNYAWKNNMMYRLATGKYITYLNDDDRYSSDYYQSYLDIFESVPEAQVVYTGQKAYLLDPAGGDDHKLRYVLAACDIKRCMFFCVDQNCVAHTKEVYEKAGGWCCDPHVNMYADAEFWFRIAQAGYLAYPTGKYTSIKSIHPGALSQTAQAAGVAQ